jgi:hypothetical protein
MCMWFVSCTALFILSPLRSHLCAWRTPNILVGTCARRHERYKREQAKTLERMKQQQGIGDLLASIEVPDIHRVRVDTHTHTHTHTHTRARAHARTHGHRSCFLSATQCVLLISSTPIVCKGTGGSRRSCWEACSPRTSRCRRRCVLAPY